LLCAAVKSPFDYNKAWNEIDALQNKGMLKSMLAEVDSLYKAAQKGNKADQQIKALIYKLKIQQQIEEFSDQKAIDFMQAELKKASFPVTSVIHSMLAQLYIGYYQQNRWRYSQRTDVANFDLKDIATWDLRTIFKAAISEYELSLQNAAELQKYKIDDYPAFVNFGTENTRKLQPTLYDFLAHRALEFYAKDESGLTTPFEEFTITDTKFFQPAESFVRMVITSPDSLSLKFKAVLLYQDMLRFHLNDKDVNALGEVDLDRLNFVYNVCKIADSEQYYEAALRLTEMKYAGFEVSDYAIYLMARLVHSLGGKYNPEISEQYRWNYKIALDICEEAKYPNSFGGQSCAALKSEISNPWIDLRAENYNLPNSSIKILFKQKSITETEIRIYRLRYPSMQNEEWESEEKLNTNNFKKIRQLVKQKPVWRKVFKFEKEGDYREHSYELALGELRRGYYIIISGIPTETGKDYKSLWGYTVVNITELSFISRTDNRNNILICSRRTGHPIQGATVRMYEQEYNKTTHKYFFKLFWTGQSDTKGMVQIPLGKNRWNTKLLITKGTDTLRAENYYGGSYKHRRSINAQSLLFTDRAIYRPGQTVYLKGIYFETDGEKHNKLLPGRQVTATFYDVNHQVVSQQNLTTNEYGTFNCTFTAPQGVLP